MRTKRQKLIKIIQILSIGMAAGVVILSVERLMFGQSFFADCALGLAAVSLVLVTGILALTVRSED
ncbi:MAG: hypothetical protein Q8Q08_00720 [Candidatus Omnitrophota bacterium]|nr:hypothetical protein [Candidatus Omnitrophota bacterium]MDZ4242055.1 hypothetical protein [Candidatus Omnitrophota bacterium]